MAAVFRGVLSTNVYPTQVEKQRARMMYGVALLMMLFFTVYGAFVSEARFGDVPLFSAFLLQPIALGQVVGLYGVGLLTLYAIHRGNQTLSGIGLLVMWMIGGCLGAVQEAMLSPGNNAALLMLVVLGGLLLREPGAIVATLIALICLVVGIGLRPTVTSAPTNNLADLLTMGLQLLATGVLLLVYMRGTRLGEMELTARAADEQLRLARITTEVARRIARRMGLNDVLSNAVEQISASYPTIYHAQIFLVDPRVGEARLAASTGEVGKLLLKRAHALAVGSRSVIGQVTSLGEPVVARSSSPDTVHRRNEFLPETAVEAAFPLRVGDVIIGALDLQSKDANAFTEGDLPIFQSLADTIAVAIDNARLAEQTEQRLQENQHLIEQMRGAMSEVERLNRELTATGWTDYLDVRGSDIGVGVDLEGSGAAVAGWTPMLVEAMRFNHFVQQETDGGLTIAVPLRVRNAVIGALEFELPGSSALAPDELNLLLTISDRLGQAIENARLYDDSRRLAQREAMLNEIGGRLQTSNDVSGVLTTAARSLREALGAQKVAIRLGPPPANGGTRGEAS